MNNVTETIQAIIDDAEAFAAFGKFKDGEK